MLIIRESKNTLQRLMVFICVIFDSVSSLVQHNKYEFDEATGVWFNYHEIPLRFTDAFLHCKAEGALLASPTNDVFTKSMIAILATKNVCSSCLVYTGINAFISKGDYFTSEGIPLTTMPISWAPGAPDNYENSEDCLVMLPNGKLDDKSCNGTYPYICYKTMEKVLTNPTCGNNDKGYNLDARTGSCYKFHNVGRSWVRAYMTCAAEGGYLTIPNSLKEINVLKELYGKYTDANLFAYDKTLVGVGFHALYQQSEWLTVKGETLEEAGYAVFSNGQPDNSQKFDGGERCGTMYRNGGLNDVYCYSITMPFICEKDPTYIHI